MKNLELTVVDSEVNTPEAAAYAPAVAAADAVPARLIGLQCTFNTTDDNKDHDTTVNVHITNNAVVMGSGNVGGGEEWGDNSQRVVNIPIVNAIAWEQGEHGTITITIHPNGDDEWHFNLTLLMTYERGGWRRVGWNGFNVAEDRATQSAPW
jgi:hypothetical protein